ncbi:MAG: nitrate reductase molybdenum cofactor assembly chaperone [Maricaulaceae bacterium]|nr:nitrate reductase molybdenum cofactor assembly chaperone [Maricaulaceae bacterium]
MAATFKALALLLSYPTEDIQAAAPELKRLLNAEGLVPEPLRLKLNRLIGELDSRDLMDLQERYVLLFDRTRSLSLHLFEHVHGEGRDRGQAMVDLQTLYAEHGLEIAASELPDYLPMFLEFLSTLETDKAQAMLGEPLHVVAALRQRLQKRKSVYAGVFLALEAIAAGRADEAALAELLAMDDDDPDDLIALDRAWEDEPVTFGPDSPGKTGGCPKAEDMLARIKNPPAEPRAEGGRHG